MSDTRFGGSGGRLFAPRGGNLRHPVSQADITALFALRGPVTKRREQGLGVRWFASSREKLEPVIRLRGVVGLSLMW
jgi:hypothetical protein